jgi:PAS domain S-box-containing protein
MTEEKSTFTKKEALEDPHESEKPYRELAKAEEAVRGSEARYRQLFENMTEGFAIGEPLYDEEGKPVDFRFLIVNNAFERQSGLTREVLGRPMREVLPGLDEHWIKTYCQVALSGQPVLFESYNKNLNRHLQIHCYSPTKGQFAILFWDVTERKQIEESLQRLSHFPGENPNPVLRSSPDGKLLYANPPARRWMAARGWRRGRRLPDPIQSAVIEARRKNAAFRTDITDATGRTMNVSAVQPSGEDYINVYGIDITDRKQAEEMLRENEKQLRNSLEEKEVLLKEIHHRVKNNMQVISSLVALQTGEAKDEAIRSVLRDVTHRVRSMAMVHEKLYQSGDLAHVEFDDYAESLLNYLWRAQRADTSNIEMVLNLKPLPLSINQAVPCGLILNELVSNALNHAFQDRDSGEVRVELLESEQGLVQLRVVDNGTGLPEGFDWTQSKTLGLRLVLMLSGQLHAKVEVHSSEKGTRFDIAFKLITS